MLRLSLLQSSSRNVSRQSLYSAAALNKRFMSSSEKAPSMLDTAESVPLDQSSALLETAQDVAMKIGDLKAAGLCNWTPPGLIESMLEFVQVNSGLPWWMTIMATAFTLRTLISPLQINSLRSSAVLARIQPDLKGLMAKYEDVKRVKDYEQMAIMQRQIQAVYHKNGISMFSAFKGAFLSAPITVSFFLALQDITALNLPSLKTGGMLWFTDLTVPDPYYALPLMAAGSFLYVVEKGMEVSQTSNSSESQKKMNKNIFRIMAVGSIPVMATYPAALSMYWVTNSFFTIAFTTAVRHPYIVEKLKLDGCSLKPIVSVDNNDITINAAAATTTNLEPAETPVEAEVVTKEQLAKSIFNNDAAEMEAPPIKSRHLHLKKQANL